MRTIVARSGDSIVSDSARNNILESGSASDSHSPTAEAVENGSESEIANVVPLPSRPLPPHEANFDFFHRRRLARLKISSAGIDDSNGNDQVVNDMVTHPLKEAISTSLTQPFAVNEGAEFDRKGAQVPRELDQVVRSTIKPIPMATSADARLRLLRARIAAGKELERSKGSSIGTLSDTLSPAVSSTTDATAASAFKSLDANPAPDPILPQHPRGPYRTVTPSGVTDGDKQRSEPADVDLLSEEAALRRVLLRRRSHANTITNDSAKIGT